TVHPILPPLRLVCRFSYRYSHGDRRDLHPFPTRRSSDLSRLGCELAAPRESNPGLREAPPSASLDLSSSVSFSFELRAHLGADRSEEHTSELQSRENLVCRLLLEKKKRSMEVRVSSSAAR